ncbi:MAG: sensor histidine kinase [bacterium]
MGKPGELLEEISLALPLLADIAHSELLLLFPEQDGTLKVVSHAKPSTAPFIYRRSREGETLSPHTDSLPYLALRKLRMVRGIEGEMVRGIPVWRWAAPIFLEDELIGIVEVDQNLLQRRMSRISSRYLRLIASLLNRTLFGGEVDEKIIIQMLKQGDGKVLRKEGKIIFLDQRARAIYRKLGIHSPLHKEFVEGELEGAIRLITRRKEVHTEEEIQFGSTIILKREIELVDSYTLSILCDISLLRRRLQEKMLRSEVVQEMHHQVKNILQTVISILRMQRRRVSEESAGAALDEAIERLSSIATVHELLSEGGIEGVDFRELAERLITMARSSLGVQNVNVHLEGISPLFSPPVVSLIAIMINELLQNAFRYAFEGRGGNLWVRLNEEGDKLVLEVIDDGKGLPRDFRFGLGLSIVKGLAEELGGKFEITSDEGTKARIVFPTEIAIWELEY